MAEPPSSARGEDLKRQLFELKEPELKNAPLAGLLNTALPGAGSGYGGVSILAHPLVDSAAVLGTDAGIVFGFMQLSPLASTYTGTAIGNTPFKYGPLDTPNLLFAAGSIAAVHLVTGLLTNHLVAGKNEAQKTAYLETQKTLKAELAVEEERQRQSQETAAQLESVKQKLSEEVKNVALSQEQIDKEIADRLAEQSKQIADRVTAENRQLAERQSEQAKQIADRLLEQEKQRTAMEAARQAELEKLRLAELEKNKADLERQKRDRQKLLWDSFEAAINARQTGRAAEIFKQIDQARKTAAEAASITALGSSIKIGAIKGRLFLTPLIFESQIANGVFARLIGLDGSKLENRIFIPKLKSPAMLSGEKFVMEGRVVGTYSYKTANRERVTVPSVKAELLIP
jgi:hypothetical protein